MGYELTFVDEGCGEEEVDEEGEGAAKGGTGCETTQRNRLSLGGGSRCSLGDL